MPPKVPSRPRSINRTPRTPPFLAFGRLVTVVLLRPVVKIGHGSTAAFCVPPPRPSPAANAAGATSSVDQGTEWDGPLVLNALLVVTERYSSLKRARFGSETSAESVRGMRILVCLAGDVDGKGGGVIAQGKAGSVASGVERSDQGGCERSTIARQQPQNESLQLQFPDRFTLCGALAQE